MLLPVVLVSSWLVLLANYSRAQTSASCAAQDAVLDPYDGLARCVCRDAYNVIWTPEGCVPCPPFETPFFDPKTDIWSCGCAWPTTEVDGICECPSRTYKDYFSNKCSSCGYGTDPSALGCSCVDPSKVFDRYHNCVPSRRRDILGLHV